MKIKNVPAKLSLLWPVKFRKFPVHVISGEWSPKIVCIPTLRVCSPHSKLLKIATRLIFQLSMRERVSVPTLELKSLSSSCSSRMLWWIPRKKWENSRTADWTRLADGETRSIHHTQLWFVRVWTATPNNYIIFRTYTHFTSPRPDSRYCAYVLSHSPSMLQMRFMIFQCLILWLAEWNINCAGIAASWKCGKNQSECFDLLMG